MNIKTALSLFLIFLLWRFWSFYLVKDVRKGRKIFWSSVVLAVTAGTSIFFLRDEISKFGRSLFNFLAEAGLTENLSRAQRGKVFSSLKTYVDKIFAPLAAAGVLVVVIEIIFGGRLTKKDARHGPKFSPGRRSPSPKAGGITVGRFDREVLPAQVREFAPEISSEINVPCDYLSRGVTILGDMGSGKSRLMAAIYEGIRQKYPDIPILLHDPKGEWLRTYYDLDRDIIFAPHDRRSLSWTMWKDFKRYPEIRHPIISTAIESHHSGSSSDRFWADSGILLLKDAAAEISVQAAKQKIMKLRRARKDDVTWQSIYTTALIGFRDLASVELMNASGGGMSIDYFLNYPGNIFLLNNPGVASEQHGALTLLLSAFMMRVLSKPDVNTNAELRAAVIMDEALAFHLPEDVERAVYTQSRSKGLAIIASAQRLPKTHGGERGAWADHPAHIFGMRVTDMETRQTLAKRVGNITYDEKQKSVSSGDKSSSVTETETQRHHDALAPEDWALASREFILIHESGLACGRVKDVELRQRDIKVIDYDPRDDVTRFMEGL